MANLTPKQERFCELFVRFGDKSKAYRGAYDAENMKPENINNKAYELSERGDIRGRIEELRAEVREKEVYTLEKSIKRDISLIEKYEAALEILENADAPQNEVKAAERMIKFIGAQGYNSAQERLSKQHGFFERDNSQKQSDISIPIIEWVKE